MKVAASPPCGSEPHQRLATRARTHKSRLFGNRWLPQTTCADCAFRRSSAAVATSCRITASIGCKEQLCQSDDFWTILMIFGQTDGGGGGAAICALIST